LLNSTGQAVVATIVAGQRARQARRRLVQVAGRVRPSAAHSRRSAWQRALQAGETTRVSGGRGSKATRPASAWAPVLTFTQLPEAGQRLPVPFAGRAQAARNRLTSPNHRSKLSMPVRLVITKGMRPWRAGLA